MTKFSLPATTADTTRASAPVRMAAAVFIAGAIAACAPTVDNHGNMPDKAQVAAIKPGQTTRQDVVRRLGSPSAISAFDNKTWFYIANRKTAYAFFTPTLKAQQVLEIQFADSGVVSAVKRYGMKDARKVKVVSRTTPTRGREPGLVRSLMDLLINGPVNRNSPTFNKQ